MKHSNRNTHLEAHRQPSMWISKEALVRARLVHAGVHDGFYAALFHRPEGSSACLFDEIVGVLRREGCDEEAGQQLPLYLTGHSLGGAIASVFAQALRAQVAATHFQGCLSCLDLCQCFAPCARHPYFCQTVSSDTGLSGYF